MMGCSFLPFNSLKENMITSSMKRTILLLSVIIITLSATSVRYLETNAWLIRTGKFSIAIDPVLYSPLDFGIPLLYSGKKRYIDGRKELEAICSTDGVDCVLLTQGLDDHAHTPTLKYMSTRRPDMKYIAPPSAISVLKSCGIPDNCVTVLSPGQTHILTKKKESSVPFGQNRGDTLKITATTGALVGPPWQAPENGYILQPEPTSPFDKPVSLYYEPHCMYDPAELSRFSVDYVISPVVSQELPFFTLVAGGEKALKLAEILKAKAIIPMANGELDQSGILASIIRSEGSVSNLVEVAKAKGKIQVLDVTPGVDIPLSK